MRMTINQALQMSDCGMCKVTCEGVLYVIKRLPDGSARRIRPKINETDYIKAKGESFHLDRFSRETFLAGGNAVPLYK